MASGDGSATRSRTSQTSVRRHLNTLYVTTENAWLRKDGENVVVKVDGAEVGRVPIHLLGGIVCFGSVGITPQLMGHCAKHATSLSFLSRGARFLARIEGPVSGNVRLRRSQYRCSDDEQVAAHVARDAVMGKILNQRTVVRRAIRDHRRNMKDHDRQRLRNCERRLTNAARRASNEGSKDALRGIEGESARAYYSVFDVLIRSTDARFAFKARSRRPPLNPVNAMLSFLYSLLLHDCRSALETVGLDPAVGFLHEDRPGRASLALDLMEELRPVISDRVCLSLINRRQVSPEDFSTAVSGAVSMRDDARKTLLVTYQERKKRELTHPFLGEKTTLGLVPFVQARLLARRLRGELDAYPPFIWR